MKDLQFSHVAGLGSGPVADDKFFGRPQQLFNHFQVLIGKHQFPVRLLHSCDDREDLVEKDVRFDDSILLGNVDERLVHIDSEISKKRLGDVQLEFRGVGGIEQKAVWAADESPVSGEFEVQVVPVMKPFGQPQAEIVWFWSKGRGSSKD